MKTALEPGHEGPALQQLRVIDAMHPGVISCPPETSLRTVARMMATYRVHAIIVHTHSTEELPEGGLWGVVSDVDLLGLAGAADFDELTAETAAATPALTVTTTDPLARAVQVMAEHEVAHVIVLERRSLRPIGVISTLDVARALAGFP